jgi:DNA (cytosine-5)-methyltransferase 1
VIVVDLFAGAGGLDLALRALGLDPLGVELDDAACATREAAGLRTVQADVAALDPQAFAPCWGLCGSPPCQAFSAAGKGEGRDAMSFYFAAIERMGHGESIDRAEMDEACGDERAHLVLEPLRWALALMPRWIVLEQVPPVLPLWEAMAGVLRERGYSVWTGLLSAERYGVPQTRKRAFLLASLDGPVSMPRPTHQRYVAPPKRKAREEIDEAHGGGMFDVTPERIVVAEDCHLLPWVSMAEALGWGMTARPSVSLLAKTGGTGGHRPLEGGSGAREMLARARAAGRWIEGPAPAPAPTVTGGGTGAGGGVEVFGGREARERAAGAVRFVQRSNYSAGSAGTGTAAERGRTERRSDAPSVAITSKGFQWVLRSGQSVAGEGRAEREAGEPSLTVIGRFDLCSWAREGEPPTHYDRRQEHGPRDEDGKRERVRLIPVDEPAPTIAAAGLARGRDVWVTERPSTSTTVNGDPRLAEPGRHDPDQSGSQYGPQTVRVSIEEAAALQTFPPDYPWRGNSKTAQYQQVGNAVPPLLALRVFEAVPGLTQRREGQAA